MTISLFNSVEEALTFAFNYAKQQSPRNPMSSILQGGVIGKGKGLHGVDGAAQAGMILAKLDDLEREQRYVLTVRFGSVKIDCPCCGQPAYTQEWLDAIAMLGCCPEIDGVHKAVKQAVIAKILCREKVNLTDLCKKYGVVLRTLHTQQAALKKRLQKAENQGLNAMREKLESILPKGDM